MGGGGGDSSEVGMIGEGRGGGGGGREMYGGIFCTPPCASSTAIGYSTVIDAGGSASLPSNQFSFEQVPHS